MVLTTDATQSSMLCTSTWPKGCAAHACSLSQAQQRKSAQHAAITTHASSSVSSTVLLGCWVTTTEFAIMHDPSQQHHSCMRQAAAALKDPACATHRLRHKPPIKLPVDRTPSPAVLRTTTRGPATRCLNTSRPYPVTAKVNPGRCVRLWHSLCLLAHCHTVPLSLPDQPCETGVAVAQPVPAGPLALRFFAIRCCRSIVSR